jgi:hypothetical protein
MFGVSQTIPHVRLFQSQMVRLYLHVPEPPMARRAVIVLARSLMLAGCLRVEQSSRIDFAKVGSMLKPNGSATAMLPERRWAIITTAARMP